MKRAICVIQKAISDFVCNSMNRNEASGQRFEFSIRYMYVCINIVCIFVYVFNELKCSYPAHFSVLIGLIKTSCDTVFNALHGQKSCTLNHIYSCEEVLVSCIILRCIL